MMRLRLMFWTLMGGLMAAAISLAVLKYVSTASPIRAAAIPAGDQEIAWFHTATSTTTWERFVTGIHHLAAKDDQWVIDDTKAFLDRTTEAPEVIVGRKGAAHHLHIRWYKQSREAKVEDWIKELAERDTPPMAVMGGGSSDRALELIRALEARSVWNGPRPLLLITTATANEVLDPEEGKNRTLMSRYSDRRTFRFCFTNKQMADAVLDFVWWKPELRPFRRPSQPAGTMVGGSAAAGLSDFRPTVTALVWDDDPYSVDLVNQFKLLSAEDSGTGGPMPAWRRYGGPPPLFQRPQPIKSSVGGFLRPNRWEAAAVEQLLSDPPRIPQLQRSLPRGPNERAIFILSSIPAPARRVLANLAGEIPGLGRNLVAVAGDGISFNHVYRDADLLWDIHQVPVPLVFFTHQNPVEWDDDNAQVKYPLKRPNGTDDVLHFSETVRIVSEAAFDIHPSDFPTDELIPDADVLRERLIRSDYFEDDGDRKGGSGEYIVYLRPSLLGNDAGGSQPPAAMLQVWTRAKSGWSLVKELPVTYR